MNARFLARVNAHVFGETARFGKTRGALRVLAREPGEKFSNK
jgi:hypothetical protein